MRSRLTVVLSVVVLALSAVSVQAQARNRNPQKSAALGQLQIPVAVLDSICKLEPAQKEKIAAIQAKLVEDLKALRPARGTAPDPEARQKRRDLTRAAMQDINAILTPEQRELLRGVQPLLTTLKSASIPLDVLAELKLTDAQKKEILDFVMAEREKLRGLPAEERRAKARDMAASIKSKVEAVLTDEQKEAIRKFREKNRNTRRNRP